VKAKTKKILRGIAWIMGAIALLLAFYGILRSLGVGIRSGEVL